MLLINTEITINTLQCGPFEIKFFYRSLFFGTMFQATLKNYVAKIICSRMEINIFEHLKILNTIVTRFPNH